MTSRKSVVSVFYAHLAAVSLFAVDCEENIIGALTNDIHNFTKTATEIKQNIDYQPFIMSIWEGENLSKLGALTLGDALTMFTGVDVSIDNVRHKSPIFRGSNPFAYGQSKLIVDGIVINDRTFDGYSIHLDMPIELIKRIEIIRGPGSFAEGANGYAGTINVITHSANGSKTPIKAYALTGADKTFEAGGVYGLTIDDLKLGVDFYIRQDDFRIDTNGKDALSFSPVNSALSRSGVARAGVKSSSLGAALSNGEFSIIGRINLYEAGSAFGNLYVFPNENGKQNMPSWRLEGKYTKEALQNVTIEAKAGYMQDGWESDARSYPAGMRVGATTFADGYWADLELRNEITYAGVSFRYDGLKNHIPKIGVYTSREKNLEVRSITTNKLTGIGLVDYSIKAPFFDGSAAKRDLDKIYVSDTWNLSSDAALSFELNSDDSNDFKRQNDYRVALVWQVSDKDILKFMTTTAYRAPAWQELYGINNAARVGNRDLKPERVKSYEAQFIQKIDIEESVALNIFYLTNKNQINKINAQNQYRNAADSTIYGVETEYKRGFKDDAFIFIGHSYVNGKTSNENYLPSAAKHMLKTTGLVKLGGGFSAAATILYTGAKNRVSTDYRDPLESYLTANAVLNYDQKRWGIQLGLKNIGDSKMSYPSEQNTYANDYPTSKRFWFVKLRGRF